MLPSMDTMRPLYFEPCGETIGWGDHHSQFFSRQWGNDPFNVIQVLLEWTFHPSSAKAPQEAHISNSPHRKVEIGKE